jgi:hypothetical protein
MITAETDEEQGHMVLEAFKHYGVASGEALLAQNVSAYAWLHSSFRDVEAGIKYAHGRGWISQRGDGHLMLTNEGHVAIR